MRGRAFFGIFAVTGAAVAAACTSFSEPSDGNPDGGGDGGSAEGSSADDGAPPDGGAVGPSVIRRCDGREHTYDDFNRAEPARDGWLLNGAAQVELRDAGATPPALYSSSPPLPAGQGVLNTIRRQFNLGGEGHVCIEFDLSLEILDGGFTADSFAEVIDVDPSTGANIFLEMRAPGFALVQGTTPAVATSFVAGRWQHMVLRVPYGTADLPSVQIDDTPPVTVPGPEDTIPTTIDVDLGVEANARSGFAPAVRVHIDNFRFTTK